MKRSLSLSTVLLLCACSAPQGKVSSVASDDLCSALQNGNVSENSAKVNGELVTMDSVYGELTKRNIDPFTKGCFGSKEKAAQYRQRQAKLIAEALNT